MSVREWEVKYHRIDCCFFVHWKSTKCYDILSGPLQDCPVGQRMFCQDGAGNNLPDGNYHWPGFPHGFMSCIAGVPRSCQCCNPLTLLYVQECDRCLRAKDPGIVWRHHIFPITTKWINPSPFVIIFILPVALSFYWLFQKFDCLVYYLCK